MRDEAQELHILQMKNLLRSILFGEIDNHELAVIRHVAFVHHDWIVDTDFLYTWPYRLVVTYVFCWHDLPAKTWSVRLITRSCLP